MLGRKADDVNGAIQLIDKLVKDNRSPKPRSKSRCGRAGQTVAWTLASGNSDTDIAEAQEMIETRRHNIFKLKIGKRSVQEDVAHVARIKQAVGDAASVRVDVNTAWSLQEARWG
ncbi:enolase C-terminal domain-like protein [Sulfitobacter faviae]|uniref:enolase C-terminal domain-like protein n=1 Tax=Sulfitobacter faviae TaxID=1775881 RepID=UPI00245447B0|nr:enolase C-terminal domain-like protein [Sulfitobacter faviae]